jgi:hypothetical protein
MREYHKIDTIFERDMEGTKKLVEGRYRNPLVEYLKDNLWIFTEKVDGTNIRVHWDGHKISIGGRTDNAQIPTHLFEVLQSKFLNNPTEQLFEQKFGEVEVTLYGEGYGKKIQAGGGLYGDVDFILFDVEVGNTMLERSSVEDIAKGFGVKCVPVVLEGTIEEAINLVKSKPMSLISKEPKPSEGLIGTPKVRIYDVKGHRLIVKIKVEDFY